MKEKPLCGYCYNECVDDCCDKRRIDVLERQLAEARELIKAVAHIGIDWGYGKFELNQDHIDKARKLYEAHDQLKEQGDEYV